MTAAEALGLLLEEHLEEADFLWAQREEALRSRDYDLGELIELEERLAAHVDALLLMGAPAWEVLAPLLSGGSDGECFAAACVALASGDRDRLAALDQAIQAAAAPVPGIAGALRHLAVPAAEGVAVRLVAAPQPAARALGIDALSFRRVGPDPKALAAALADADAVVRAAAVTAAGRMQARGLLMEVDRALDDADVGVRRAALMAGVVLGSGPARDRCRVAVDRDTGEADLGLCLLGHLGDAEDLARIVRAAGTGDYAGAAVEALGWLGAAGAVSPLADLCGRPELAAAAGVAVTRITGADLEAEGLLAEAPEVDDDADDVDVDTEPAPDPARLAAWWAARADAFQSGVRYRYGVPHDPAALRRHLADAPLADRHGAALELVLGSPDGPWVETAAMGLRQRVAVPGTERAT